MSKIEMFEILHSDLILKPIFTQKWASVYMNWKVERPQFQPWQRLNVTLSDNAEHVGLGR